jgi:prepilin-type N-terminal cleavage/methylation domain-containing protein
MRLEPRMTSGPENRAPRQGFRGPHGFTFIELMLVLALIAIIFVSSAPLVSSSLRERRLRNSADQIATMVRTERSKAQNEGHREVLYVRGKGFFKKGDPPKQVAGFPNDAIVSVRYPGGSWEKPNDQALEFSPMGMVTPLSVRLETGPAWIEIDFDLLTGRVAEERYAF